MALTARVKEILSWYKSENNGVLQNLCKLMNHGTLAGTGKFIILPVDQGFEHGPARSFAKNPLAYDPSYHFELAIESGCNAYAAPYGQLAQASRDFIGEIPTIVKLNSSDSLFKEKNPNQSVNCSIKDAVAIGASAVGFTIYPGSAFSRDLYEEIRELGEEARSYGLPVIIWSYPRGADLSKEGETAIDIVAYGAHIASQLGAHIVKVKPPTAHLELDAAKKVYESERIAISTLRDRVKHVVQSCFNGKRIVIFSGGEAKGDDAVLSDIREINAGGGFGSIMGRNAFQRPRAEAVKLLHTAMAIFKE
jgi:class I fructose-bisphosphate aldolase